MTITSLAALKRALVPGTIVTLVRREHPPLMAGYDATGIARRVVRVKSRAVAFESIRSDTDKPSWLYWPKADEVSFSLEVPGAAQLFTVSGMTYRIENNQAPPVPVEKTMADPVAPDCRRIRLVQQVTVMYEVCYSREEALVLVGKASPPGLHTLGALDDAEIAKLLAATANESGQQQGGNGEVYVQLTDDAGDWVDTIDIGDWKASR